MQSATLFELAAYFLKNIHIVRSRGEDQKQEQVPLQMVTQKKKKKFKFTYFLLRLLMSLLSVFAVASPHWGGDFFG